MWLVIRPRFDEATEYSFEWAQEIVDFLEENLIPHIDLAEEKAIKENVEGVLTNDPDLAVIHYDHGSEDAIYGNDGNPVINLANNKLLKNRECFNMNCLSAKVLGVDSYWRYNTVYWGSWEVIAFITTPNALLLFKEALNFPIKRMLGGEEDWNKIMDETKENDDRIIDKMISIGETFAAAVHLSNRGSRRVWTEKTPPDDQESDCIFRRLALKLLGQKAWRIQRPF